MQKMWLILGLIFVFESTNAHGVSVFRDQATSADNILVVNILEGTQSGGSADRFIYKIEKIRDIMGRFPDSTKCVDMPASLKLGARYLLMSSKGVKGSTDALGCKNRVRLEKKNFIAVELTIEKSKTFAIFNNKSIVYPHMSSAIPVTQAVLFETKGNVVETRSVDPSEFIDENSITIETIVPLNDLIDYVRHIRSRSVELSR